MAPGWRRGGASCCGPLVSRSPTPAAGGGAAGGATGSLSARSRPLTGGCALALVVPFALAAWRIHRVALPALSQTEDCRPQFPPRAQKSLQGRGARTQARGALSPRPAPAPRRPLPAVRLCVCVCVVGGGGGLHPALGSLDLRSSSPERPQRPKPLPLHGALGKTFKRQTRVTSAVIPLKHSGPGVCPHWPRAPTRRPPGTASKSEPRPL